MNNLQHKILLRTFNTKHDSSVQITTNYKMSNSKTSTLVLHESAMYVLTDFISIYTSKKSKSSEKTCCKV